MEVASEKRIARNAVFLYLRMIVVMAVTFYTSRVILETLGETDYGVYNVVGGIVTMMSFINGALGASTSRFLTYHLGLGDNAALKKTFAATLNLHICIAILVVILGETAGLYFFYNELNIPSDRMVAAFWVYQFSIITTCINFTQVPYNASIISHEDMAIYAYVGLYEAISRLAIAYLIIISPIDRMVFYAALLMINTILIQMFYRIYTVRRYQECRFQWFYDKKLYNELISYGGWDMFGGLATVAQGQGVNIVLNIFFGPILNTARAIALQIQSGVTVFIQNILVAFRPQVIKNFAQKNYEQMYILTFRAAKFSYVVMLALTLPLCFEMEYILNIWLGDNYPEQTVSFSVITLMTAQLQTIHSAFLMCYHAIGKIKLGNALNGSLMVISLPIGYIALKMGAPAISTLVIIMIINMICQIISWVIVHKYVKYSYMELIKSVYAPCLLITIISIIIPGLIYLNAEQSIERFIMIILFGDLFLLIFAWMFGLKKNEKSYIKNLIKEKICRK